MVPLLVCLFDVRWVVCLYGGSAGMPVVACLESEDQGKDSKRERGGRERERTRENERASEREREREREREKREREEREERERESARARARACVSLYVSPTCALSVSFSLHPTTPLALRTSHTRARARTHTHTHTHRTLSVLTDGANCREMATLAFPAPGYFSFFSYFCLFSTPRFHVVCAWDSPLLPTAPPCSGQ